MEKTFESQIELEAVRLNDRTFEVDYEPLLSAHPDIESELNYPGQPISFMGKILNFPLWISSMTGGVGPARHINQNLARVAARFGLGMGLGSCRPLLESDEFFEDFNLRPIIGPDRLLLANMGIAQVEKLVATGETDKLHGLVSRLQADGLIIHVNPLQEFFQPEGDRFKRPPIEVIEEFLEDSFYPVIVKEVGQGMGPRSLRALMKLPLAAIDFGALGGTNFTKLELGRGSSNSFTDFPFLGHTAHEMVEMVLKLEQELADNRNHQRFQKQYIISGGIHSALKGWPLLQALSGRSLLGMAKSFLSHAHGSYEDLEHFVLGEITSIILAQHFLRLRKGKRPQQQDSGMDLTYADSLEKSVSGKDIFEAGSAQ